MANLAAANVRIMQNSSMRSTSRALSPYKLLPLLLLLLLFFLLAAGERLVFLFEKLIHLLLFPWRNEKFSAGHVTSKREMLPTADVPQKAKQLFERHQTATATTKRSVSTTATTTTATKISEAIMKAIWLESFSRPGKFKAQFCDVATK